MTAASGSSSSPRRHSLGAWILLTSTDVVAVSTLARCFSGPGELLIAVPACLLVHLLAGGGRRLPSLMASRAPVTGHRRVSALGGAGWAVAAIVGFMLPLAGVDGRPFSYGLPLAGTWHLAGHQLGVAWSIFSHKISPVVEAPGLVLATGWAAAALALASEVLYADAGLPAILALVPAFDIVVFTGTLGTSTGRAVELAVVAALALPFLVVSQSDRHGRRTVVMARTDGRGSSADAAGTGRRRHGADRRIALPGVTIVAALAAGVIGPVLPGATSAPLIAWHGAAAGRPHPGNGRGGGGSGRPNTIVVNDLVQVAEQEVENTDGLLFTVHSTVKTRETLLTLDRFDGVRWSRIDQSNAGSSLSVPQLNASISSLTKSPPAPVKIRDGYSQLEQVVNIADLGGSWLPTPGVTQRVEGAGQVSQLGAGGPLVAPVTLSRSLTYAIRAVLSPDSPALLATARSQPASTLPGIVGRELQLPQPVPPQIVALERSIVRGASGPYATAVRLQDYFRAGNGFRYHLPTVFPSGAIANSSQSYTALMSFLFDSRVGYCQQYATAFAVLARLAGLPTRIAVGFLPGKSIKKDEYVVTGANVHAWPEVYLGRYGWVTFEPTPGVAPSSNSDLTTSTNPTGPGGGTIPLTTLPAGPKGPNFAHGPGSSKTAAAPVHHHHRQVGSRAASQVGSSDVADVLLALLALGAAWVLGVPCWRLARRRRDRRDLRRATVAAWAAATWALAAAGAHLRRAETHHEFVVRVRQLGILSDAGNDALDRLAHRMDRTLYGLPGGAARTGGRADADAAWTESAAVRRAARRRIPWWQRLSLLVDPRDLLGSF